MVISPLSVNVVLNLAVGKRQELAWQGKHGDVSCTAQTL